MKNEQAFTLIEVLIALSLSITLLSIGSAIQVHVIDHYRAKQFLHQFHFDVLYMQQRTSTTGETLYLNIDQEKYTYDIKTGGFGYKVISRQIPKHWRIDLLTLAMPLTFTKNGNIKNPGSFRLQTPRHIYIITFPFGKGRCYVDELER